MQVIPCTTVVLSSQTQLSSSITWRHYQYADEWLDFFLRFWFSMSGESQEHVFLLGLMWYSSSLFTFQIINECCFHSAYLLTCLILFWVTLFHFAVTIFSIYWSFVSTLNWAIYYILFQKSYQFMSVCQCLFLQYLKTFSYCFISFAIFDVALMTSEDAITYLYRKLYIIQNVY